MGRTKKSVKAALAMLIECGFTSMSELWYEEEEDFTRQDVEDAYLLLLKKMGLNSGDEE